MIAAPVQCDVDGIPKGSHYVRVPIAIRQGSLTRIRLQPAIYFCLHRGSLPENAADGNLFLRQDQHPKISIKNYMSGKIEPLLPAGSQRHFRARIMPDKISIAICHPKSGLSLSWQRSHTETSHSIGSLPTFRGA